MLALMLLMYTAILVVVVALVMMALFLGYLYYIRKPYMHLPGPKISSYYVGNLTEAMPSFEGREPFVESVYKLVVEYGPVLRMFFLHHIFVFVTDPPTVKELLMNSIHSKPEVTYKLFYDIFGVRFMGKSLVSEHDHAKWAIHRRMFNPAFHRKHLKELCVYFNASADKLVKRFAKFADTKESVELMDGFGRATLDVIAKAGFGMEQELILEDNPFNDAIELVFEGMLRKFREPYMWMTPTKWGYINRVKSSLRLLRKTGRELINQRKQMKKEGKELPNDILSFIVKYSDMEEEGYDMESMIDEFVTFFVAGQETTSNLLGFAFVEMGKKPEIYQRVVEEVEAVVGDKEFITFDDAAKMEYTLLVLKETLRLYSPASGTSRSAAHDMTVCGHFIPAGTNIQLAHYVFSRLPEFYKDPFVFDPDRFTRNEDKMLYAYFPFSLGPRSCIGQQFALIEARIIIAKLLKKFRFELDPNQSLEILDQLTLKPKGRCKNFIYTQDLSSTGDFTMPIKEIGN